MLVYTLAYFKTFFVVSVRCLSRFSPVSTFFVSLQQPPEAVYLKFVAKLTCDENNQLLETTKRK